MQNLNYPTNIFSNFVKIVKRILLVFSLVFLLQQSAIAQYNFNAIIKDSTTKELLVGASVLVKGTTSGTASGADGRIKINLSKKGNLDFIVGFIGYQSKTINIAIPQKDSLLEILLSADNKFLSEITVSSVRTNSTIENVPTKIEVIGLEEVNEENGIRPGNISGLLNDMAGVQMQQVSVSSGSMYARIQGLNGRYTQFLKDGLPIYGGMSGGFSIMQIPPLDLRQVEIIKGCGSTLYGAGAIGGIINLISKNPSDKQELSITVNQTTLGETNLNLFSSKRYGKIGYTLFIGQTFQQAKDIDGDGLSDVPSVNSTVIHPKLVFYFNPKSTLTLNYTATLDKRLGGDMNYFNSGASDTLYHVNNNSQRHSGDLKWVYDFSDKSNLTVKFSNSLLNDNLTTKYYNFNASQYLYYSEISYFKSFNKLNWVFGINFNGDIFNNKTKELPDIENYSQNTTGFFIQNTWQATEKLSVETGFREDYSSSNGFYALPRLSFMYKFNKVFTARINSGLGYKVPDLLSYLDPETDLKSFTKPNLQTEISQGYNADINFQKLFPNGLTLTINQSFFITNINKPIYDSSAVSSKIKLANANNDLLTNGLQTYIRLKVEETELYLGYVFTNVMKKYDAAHPTPYATPKHTLSSTCMFELSDQFSLGIEASYIAGQLNDNYQPTKDYMMFAAMAKLNLGAFSFVLNCENPFDYRQSRYEKIYDGTIYNPIFHKLWAPIEGRVVNFSIKWQIR